MGSTIVQETAYSKQKTEIYPSLGKAMVLNRQEILQVAEELAQARRYLRRESIVSGLETTRVGFTCGPGSLKQAPPALLQT